MLDDTQITTIMHALTLADRPGKRAAWLGRGFRKIHARGPDALANYWRRRLATDRAAGTLAVEVWDRYQHHKAQFQAGPGSQLERVLGWFFIRPAAGCKCRSRAAEMNRRGLDWCMKNRGVIIDWLRDESRQRWPFLPFVPLAAHSLLSFAFLLSRRASAHQNPTINPQHSHA